MPSPSRPPRLHTYLECGAESIHDQKNADLCFLDVQGYAIDTFKKSMMTKLREEQTRDEQ